MSEKYRDWLVSPTTCDGHQATESGSGDHQNKVIAIDELEEVDLGDDFSIKKMVISSSHVRQEQPRKEGKLIFKNIIKVQEQWPQKHFNDKRKLMG